MTMYQISTTTEQRPVVSMAICNIGKSRPANSDLYQNDLSNRRQPDAEVVRGRFSTAENSLHLVKEGATRWHRAKLETRWTSSIAIMSRLLASLAAPPFFGKRKCRNQASCGITDNGNNIVATKGGHESCAKNTQDDIGDNDG